MTNPSHPPRQGIIPALAGNTRASHPCLHRGPDHPRSRGEYTNEINVGQCVLPDHPRSRGEYLLWLTTVPVHVGSSPLSRGILFRSEVFVEGPGIIPALAGNTKSPTPTPPVIRDHPRSRGEYAIPAAISSSYMGSSPLSRGIPCRIGRSAFQLGIIPALAGNTTLYNPANMPVADHPRSRGEYIWHIGHLPARCGSSPLSRGILVPRFS